MDDDKQYLEQELDNLSYEDLCEITQSSLRRLIAADPLLQDLPGDVTTEEVLAQIAVAQGKSITVVVLRHYETPLHVVVRKMRLCAFFLYMVIFKMRLFLENYCGIGIISSVTPTCAL